MTERPLLITTQVATPIQPATNASVTNSASDAHPVTESVDEEPYTIKCICDYSDDDGNTIYCEQCDTWQHTECFYPGRVEDASREDFDHSCIDCKPRFLDGKRATDRQRHQRQNKASNDSGDKKAKRPPSKSHKKKTKPAELQVNGHDNDAHKNGSTQEHHPPKKAKGHRSSHSVNSQIKRSPLLHGRPNTQVHPPSPTHIPLDLPQDIHSYSDLFLRLYDEDAAVQRNPTNSIASLSVTNSMSGWLRDSEILRKDTGIRDKDEAFQYLKVSLTHSLKWPELRVERRDATINGMALSWRYLTTPTALSVAGRIGELNGLVGFQKDYCEDGENKWIETAHPRPFIFFLPRLPLFIDSRNEGSMCRYVRRSCRANTTLETFIANGSEYHFWLVSERPLVANEQITIPWDFRFPANLKTRFLHLLGLLSDDDGTPFDGAVISDGEYDQLTVIIDLVLSDHGGCACDLGNDCAFARFHRNYHGKSHTQSNGIKSKKGRKPKQTHISPTSTGHATNSRAASEGQPDHVDDEDSRSLSGSTRSKPQSRDLTPLHGVETNGAEKEPSDREKRKLAMLEDTFRKMEQGQPPRKKKRASDGSTMSASTNGNMVPSTSKPRQRSVAPRVPISQSTGQSTNPARGRQYVDASTSRRQSGSPYSAVSPTAALASPQPAIPQTGSKQPSQSRQASAVPKVVYTDSTTQTDDVENAWWKEPKLGTRKSVLPLSKRLLKNRHKIQVQQQDHQKEEQVYLPRASDDQSVQALLVVAMDLDTPAQEEHNHSESPTESKDRNLSIVSSSPSVEAPSASTDVSMPDASAIVIGNSIKPPPPPWPGQINTSGGRGSSPAHKSPELRVQMPVTTNFSTPHMSGPLSGSITPSSATGSVAQSPFGTVHFPSVFSVSAVNGIGQNASPIKTTKKLTLKDYSKRNAKETKPHGGSSPTGSPAVLRHSLSTVEETKTEGAEGSAVVDSALLEKGSNSLTPGPGVAIASKNNHLCENPNGTTL